MPLQYMQHRQSAMVQPAVGCVAAAYVDRTTTTVQCSNFRLPIPNSTQTLSRLSTDTQTAAPRSPPDRPNKLQTQSPACQPARMDAGRLAEALSELPTRPLWSRRRNSPPSKPTSSKQSVKLGRLQSKAKAWG